MFTKDSPFVLGVDLDGVCADYTTAFREIVARELDVDFSSLPLKRSWDFNEWGLTTEEYKELHQIAVDEYSMLRQMPSMDNAAEVLWRLSDAGIWIRVITHRLYVNWTHAKAVVDTVEWLDNARIPYRDLCFLGDKPQVGADLYIDDAPHNIEALTDSGNQVIIFDAPYNKKTKGIRAHDWESCEHLILEEAAKMGFEIQAQLPGSETGIRDLKPRNV